MCASPFSFIKNGPPPPAVALLPDALFFTRQIPVASEATREDVATAVELALEANAPFPLSQVFYGFYWVEGAGNALAYAAYRRRFTVEQTDLWSGSKYVIPSFVAVLGADHEPASTFLLSSEEALTAIYWGGGDVPTEVISRLLPPEITEEERAKLREDLLKRFPGTKKVVELESPAIALPSRTDKMIEFSSGGLHSALPASALQLADVRDRGELQAIRRGEARDLVMWRVAVGCVLAFVALGLAELGLAGGNLWQKARILKLNGQKPAVDHIMTEQDLALRIDELSTKRLLPMEMLTILADKKPAEIEFARVNTTGRYTLQVEAVTANAGEIPGFRTALENNPACERVHIDGEQAVGANVRFTLVVDFKPDAVLPAPPPPPAT
jgi:hypothetical protein